VKFFLDNLLLIGMVLFSGLGLLGPGLFRSGGGKGVSVQQAVQLMNREKAVLLDVCTAEEFAAGHAAGAVHAPLDSLAQHTQLPKNKDLPVLLICASGGRSQKAVAMLEKLGYTQVHSVMGGNAAWREANMPTRKA
jgi:rhodanese-related sulfurtransferase